MCRALSKYWTSTQIGYKAKEANMGFNINNFLNAESKKEIKSDWKPIKVSARKLRPAPDKKNFDHA